VKKIAALFLLFLFLLNVLGYYGVFVGLQVKTTQQMRQNFDDDNYDHQEITFKVPLTVPYNTDSKEYSRVDGEFEHNGEVYRLVKQRFQSDTLYIVCVKDNTSKDINQALEDYVKTFTDKPVSSKGNSKNIQNLIKDYITQSISIEKQNSGWEKTLSFYLVEHQYELVNSSLAGPPPRA
jgi:ribosomal protein S17E